MRKLIRKILKHSWGLPPDPHTTYCPSPESDGSLRKNWWQAIGHRLSAISGYLIVVLLHIGFKDKKRTSIYTIYSYLNLYFLNWKRAEILIKFHEEVQTNQLIEYNQLTREELKIPLNGYKGENVASWEMVSSEKVAFKIDDIKEKLESCIKKDNKCAELDEFYIEVADKNLKTIEEVKCIVKDIFSELQIVIQKMPNIKDKKISIDSNLKAIEILKLISNISINYWEYTPNQIKSVFIELYKKTKKQEDKDEKLSIDKAKKNFTKIIIFFELLIFFMKKRRNLLLEMDSAVKEFQKAIETGMEKDIENEIDWELSCEALENIEITGTLKWDEIKDELES